MPSSTDPDPRAVILVEGASDQRAVETLAKRRGRDLVAERVSVVAMGGITNLRRHLVASTGAGAIVTVLFDVAERAHVRRTLDRLGSDALVFGCDRDLEDELIRALGVPVVTQVIEANGDLASWRTLLRQPFHRERLETEVLRRFLGTTSGRKIAYAGLLVEALDLARVPGPLDGVLATTVPS
ncbi:MAG: TOPRIM nucleotidyl transferase/hydrolase domain-containing protein [Nocardioides sp.]